MWCTSSKYSVLSEDGWRQCLQYVAQYANNPEYIDYFKYYWKSVVERQLQGKSQQMVEKYHERYQDRYQRFLKYKDYWLGCPLITLELMHWHGLPKDQYIARLEDIQKNTFWGELVLQCPVLRSNHRFDDSFIEIWTIHGTKNDKKDSKFTINQKKAVYKKCCGVCGYDAML